jgi:hypothetical protein
MKRFFLLLITISVLLITLSCDKEEGGIPEITFNEPAIGSTFNSGDTIRFSATVKDDDLRYIGWAVVVDSNNTVITGFTDSLKLKNVVYRSAFVITTARFADYKIRITAGDQSGNVNQANRSISVRP